MRSSSYPRAVSLDAVFDWFMELNLPYWVLYRGHLDKKSRTNAITTNTVNMSVEASWERLERNIINQSNGGGQFTILVTSKPNSNYGFTSYLELSKAEIIPTTIPNQAIQNQSVNGVPVNAVGGIQGYVDNQIAAVETRMQLEFQNQRLQERIEQLENSAPEKMGERIIEYLMQNGDKYLDKIVQLCAVFKGNGPTVSMAVNGAPIPKQENPNPMKENSQAPQTQEELIQRMASARERIIAHVDLLLVLENLADVIEQNPDKVVALIQDKAKLSTLVNLL